MTEIRKKKRSEPKTSREKVSKGKQSEGKTPIQAKQAAPVESTVDLAASAPQLGSPPPPPPPPPPSTPLAASAPDANEKFSTQPKFSSEQAAHSLLDQIRQGE